MTDIKTAFGGFSNSTIVMLASFMAIIAALQKTSFIVKFKALMYNMANKGGFKAYVLLIVIVMLGCSLFGTGSTAYYVLVIGLLSTLPYNKQLPPSKVLMPAGFAANHPLVPFNTALQYGIVIAVLGSAGVTANVNLLKFSLVNLSLSLGFLAWCVIGIADALGNTGLTNLVGETVAQMLGGNVNPFVLIFVFCVLTSVLATLTGSTIGTVYVFAPMAIATCVNLGLDPTAAASAIVISGWCGHFLPIDGMPAMIMGTGNYKITEFWKFTIPQYFIRLLALTVGAVLIFPM